MKNKLLLYTIITSLFSIGCMGHGYNNHQDGYYNNHKGGNYSSYRNGSSFTNSDSNMKSVLEYMYDEERLAKDIYLALYSKYRIKQLYKIATNSETKHIDSVNRLADRYGVPMINQRAGLYKISKIQDLYNSLYEKGIRSQRDALEVGCMVEVTDINDLEEYITTAQRVGANDVVQTFNSLKRGSYNHYWAFDRALKQIGIDNGCCSLGREYCHPEYPQNSKGGGRGHGGGRWR